MIPLTDCPSNCCSPVSLLVIFIRLIIRVQCSYLIIIGITLAYAVVYVSVMPHLVRVHFEMSFASCPSYKQANSEAGGSLLSSYHLFIPSHIAFTEAPAATVRSQSRS